MIEYEYLLSFFFIVISLIFYNGIRKTGFRLLKLFQFFRRLYLKYTGNRTEQSESEKRVISGKVWEEFCDSLKSAGAALVYPGCPQDAFNQAEGHRYLTRLIRGGLESFMECNDPQCPVLVSVANGLRDAPVKLGADNPDNLYLNANLDSRETYVLRGNRGTVNYLGFGTQAGSYGQAGGLQTVMSVDFEDLEYVTTGNDFEIIISSKRPLEGGRNWLELLSPSNNDDGTIRAMLIIRQTFLDRTKEVPAQFELKRISGPHEPSQLTCAQLEEALQTTALFVCGASLMFSKWCAGYQKHVNELPLFDQETSNKAGGDPQIRYYHSYWHLKNADDCLIIETIPPKCEHWNFQLNNHWMESLDYRYFTIHVNKHTANYNRKNGQVRVIISHKNPEEYIDDEQVLSKIRPYNWINTVNHSQGQMLWRWVKPKCDDSQLPKLKTRVVKFGEF